MPRVIITGGTGMVGSELSRQLKEKGYEIAILTRNPKRPGEFKWDIEGRYIDTKIFDKTLAIIHLSGAGVADKPWTDERKKEILDSRIKSAALLHDYLEKTPHMVRTFISASAAGYYGDAGDQVLTETSPNGMGFLANVCREWENSADRISNLNIRVCKLRLGVVLNKEDGALPKMALPVKFGVCSYFGDGKQYISWIHLEDLCRAFIHALENEKLEGVYNACAPEVPTNYEMTRYLAKALHRIFIPVPIPEFILKMTLGERAELVLMSGRCSPEKLISTGFQFRYPDPGSALRNIYQNK